LQNGWYRICLWLPFFINVNHENCERFRRIGYKVTNSY
jgi:hypothetical protein